MVSDQLVERFEQKVALGELGPGSKFPTERVISKEFNVSRSVVREAFARLAERGILISRRGSGAYVADNVHYRAFQVTAQEVSAIEDVIKLLELRLAFEVEMTKLAAERRSADDLLAAKVALEAMDRSINVDESIAADVAFHTAIAQASCNDYYVKFTEFLGVRFVPSRRMYFQDDDPLTHRGCATAINRDHIAIYKAVVDRDTVKAGRCARRHIERSLDRYYDLVRGSVKSTWQARQGAGIDRG